MKKTRKLEDKEKKKGTLKGIAILFVVATFVPSLLEPGESLLAIKGGKILTMAGRVYEDGSLIIKKGKIWKVGKAISIPKGARIVDAQGKYVMPGIIDSMCYFGVRPFSLNSSEPVTPENRIVDAYYVFGELMRGPGGIQAEEELLCGGVTTVYIAPGSAQLIGGQGAVLKTFGRDYESLILRESASIDMTLAYAPLAESGMPSSNPPSRMSSMALLRKSLLEAQDYLKKIEEYEKMSEDEKKKSQKPSRDLGKEALASLLERKIPARIEADFVDDILAAIRLADEFKLDLVIDSGIGAYKVREILAKKKIPVVLGPPSHPIDYVSHLNNLIELQQLESERNASLLLDAGVKISISSQAKDFGGSGKATQGRWLLLEAALATGFGLSEEEALKAVTINAAQILGVADRVGSLEPGKDADVVILDGHPLRVETHVEKVFIDGCLSYEREKEE